MKDTDAQRGPEDISDSGTKAPTGGDTPTDRPRHLAIRIDRKECRVPPGLLDRGALTGRRIRRLADPDIGPDRDLFEVGPGGSDRKIGNDERVRIRNHMRFFSAPAVINPGSRGSSGMRLARSQASVSSRVPRASGFGHGTDFRCSLDHFG